MFNQIHIWVRKKIVPLHILETLVPKEGIVVDLGCGHGFFANYLKAHSSARRVIGLDLDQQKICFARSKYKDSGLEFRSFDIRSEALLESVDCITILDVLYLIPPSDQKIILEQCFNNLREGGLLICKEVDTRPKWKFILCFLEECFAVKIFRITQGKNLFFQSSKRFIGCLQKIGFEVSFQSLEKGYFHPHALFLGKKPYKKGKGTPNASSL